MSARHRQFAPRLPHRFDVDPPDDYAGNNSNTTGYAWVTQKPVTTWRNCPEPCTRMYFGEAVAACPHEVTR